MDAVLQRIQDSKQIIYLFLSMHRLLLFQYFCTNDHASLRRSFIFGSSNFLMKLKMQFSGDLHEPISV